MNNASKSALISETNFFLVLVHASLGTAEAEEDEADVDFFFFFKSSSALSMVSADGSASVLTPSWPEENTVLIPILVAFTTYVSTHLYCNREHDQDGADVARRRATS